MLISEAMKKGGKVTIRGWCHRKRGSNKFQFIVLRDESNIIQCIAARENLDEKAWEDVNKITMESSLELTGKIRKEDRAPTGYELDIESVNIIHIADVYPITKDQSPEFLADMKHLWIRSRRSTAILKIRHTVMASIHRFFQDNGYYLFDPPILQPNQCEGGATLFEVKYFDKKIFLTQSWQLYAEAAIFSLGKVYDVAPTFRAERSKTARHLSEFWMAEMEAAWMELDEVTKVAKEEIQFIVNEVLKKNQEELKILERDVKKLEASAKKEYPTITYDEALKLLKERENMDVEWGKDLRTVEEEKIMEHFDTPVVVTHYPTKTMAFYKPDDPKNPGRALCFDMLAPEGYGEIIGGSQRSTDIEDLKKRLKEQGEDPSSYEWYLDLRKYGSVPHSGYGVGVERVIAWICGLENIREAIAFPRTQRRFKP